ncbi:MAG: Methylase [Chthonomonadaceae bacterium]|nr:Methylase [Chthonomonadaceae bacterium]
MSVDQTALSLEPPPTEHLSVSALEQWLWSAACVIRGATDAPKFKDFILPLVFFKRLADVFDDEMAEQVENYGDADLAREVIEEDHAAALKDGRRPILRFYIPETVSWRAVRNHAADGSLGEFLTDCLRKIADLNPELKGVLDVKDFNERQSGQRTLDDERLAALIEIVSRHRLGLKNTRPDVLGQAYEYLLRKFAEGQGQSAGEFYTPFEAGLLMAELIAPAPYSTIYDPTCGSGGLLIKARLVFERKRPNQRSQAPRLFGQELNSVTYAMARMNMVLHDYNDSQFAIGDTFRNPGFGAQGAGLQQFDCVVANPMWNQKNYTETFYENDPWKRFGFGIPSSSSADWGWVQHIWASLKEGGRAAIVLDTGAVSRGSGSDSSSKERTIRKAFVEADAVECVILLPENLFYNTSAPGIILLLHKGKPAERQGQTILINASQFFIKEKPKNALTQEGIDAVVEVFSKWETREKLSRVVTLEEIRAGDYNLSPSQFVAVGDKVTHRPLAEILADLTDAKAERERADAHLAATLARLGLIAEASA